MVVSVGYRLAPRYRFPAAVVDSFDALRWVYEHAEELGGGKDSICVMGVSAGGNLAAVVSVLARNSGISPHASFSIDNLAELSINAGDYEVTLALVRAIVYRVSICMVVHVGIHG
jgi:acetyl esterase/lipase